MKGLMMGLILAVLAAGCRRDERGAPAPEERIATLERGLDRQRDIDTYLLEVSSWTASIVLSASPQNQEQATNTATALNERIQRVKALLDKTRSDRFSGWNPALAEAAKELRALKDAHYRALAALPAERREEERHMSERLEELRKTLAEFRVEVSSFQVAGNGEMKRRIAALEISWKESSEILQGLKQAPAANWPHLRRRWDRQMAFWEEDHNAAQDRLRDVVRSSGTAGGIIDPARARMRTQPT